MADFTIVELGTQGMLRHAGCIRPIHADRNGDKNR